MKTYLQKTLTKHWALVVWILAFLLDRQNEFVEALFKDPTIVKMVYGIGSILLSYFWGKELAKKPTTNE